MPCFRPNRVVLKDGEIRFDLDWRHSAEFENCDVINMPCRKCMGCTEGGKKDWSVRIFHEALTHTKKWRDPDTGIKGIPNTGVESTVPNNSIVTLTYDDEHLPPDGYLHHSDFQIFMKALRHAFPQKLRFYMCAEYGGETHRPHFHSIIFGETFDDRYEVQRKGKTLKCSYELDKIWGKGFATVDDFTFAGAAYVAGYVTKKTNSHGPIRPHHSIPNAEGILEVKEIAPEYRKMSTHPGLGAKWIEQPENYQKVYETDEIKISEWIFHPPKYYDTLFIRKRPEEWPNILEKRLQGQIEAANDWSQQRCAAAERIQYESLQRRVDSL